MIANNYFFGPLLFRVKIETIALEKVKQLCNKLPENDVRKDLVGHIKEEFRLDTIHFNDIMKKYYEYFRHVYFKFYGNHCPNLNTRAAWVNYMKKGEHNPSHMHSGCNFSSVMILEKPSGLKEEIKEYYKNTESNDNGPGCLMFGYGESNPHNQTCKTFEPEVGDFFIFPFWLKHWVNPFQCEGKRVTVATNLVAEGAGVVFDYDI